MNGSFLKSHRPPNPKRKVVKAMLSRGKKINVRVNGERVRQYVYLDKEEKEFLKEKAKRENVSVSRLLADFVKQAIMNDEMGIQTKMDLD